MISYIISPILNVFYFMIRKISGIISLLLMRTIIFLFKLVNPYPSLLSPMKMLSIDSWNIFGGKPQPKTSGFLSYLNPFRKEEPPKKGFFSGLFG
ncbi:hypothetical protein [Moosepox virus GoldyGopher14]|nr:hypothetical protein [Moosepox virus GoldyGopher14]